MVGAKIEKNEKNAEHLLRICEEGSDAENVKKDRKGGRILSHKWILDSISNAKVLEVDDYLV